MPGPTPETAVSQDRIIDFELEKMAAARAAATPMPGELVHALGHNSIVVCGVEVRPIIWTDFRILQIIESPVIQVMLEMQKPEEHRENVPSTDEQDWELLFLFTHSTRECWDLSKDRAKFAEASKDWMLSTGWTFTQVQSAMAAIYVQFERYGKAQAEHEAQAEGNKEITFFREQKTKSATA